MNNLESNVRRAAPAVALAITVVLLLGELAYRLGYQLGCAVHARNDQLAAAMVRLTVRPAIAVERPLREPAPAAPAPAVHPLALMAAELEQLTTRQLQGIAGCRRKVAKRQLVALTLAW